MVKMIQWDKTSQSTYQQLCQDFQLPIFYQPWWLDKVCKNGEWAAFYSYNKEGKIQGVWPYFISRRWGLKVITPPLLTPHLGPLLLIPHKNQNENQRLKLEWKIFADLIYGLPRVPIIRCKCAPELKISLPFFWMNFQQQTRYTFRLNCSEQPAILFQKFSSTLRNQILAAKKHLTIREGDAVDVPTLHRLVGLSLGKNGVKNPISLSLITALDAGIIKKNRRLLLLAEDKAGHAQAAAYILFDHHIAYLLLLGSDPHQRHRGANSLIIWEAIQQASHTATIFDFEGSMLPGVATFFAEFGGYLESYFLLTRVKNRWWHAVLAVWTTVFSKSPISFIKRSIKAGQMKP